MDFKEHEKSESESLPFSDAKQGAFLWYGLVNPRFFAQAKGQIKPEHFVNPWAQKVWRAKLKFFAEYKRDCNVHELLDSNFILSEGQDVVNNIRVYVLQAEAHSARYGLDVLTNEAQSWLQTRIYYTAISQSVDLFNKKKLTDSFSIVGRAMKEMESVSFKEEQAEDFANFEQHFDQSLEEHKNALSFGLDVFDKVLNPNCTSGSLLPGNTTVLLAPSNIGKCHGINTPVIMFDGTVKMVQDINVGDQLMGPDGTPRNVLSTTKGFGDMFEVVPKSGGDSFTCNDVHVLSLKCSVDKEPKKRKRVRSLKPAGNGEQRIWKGDIVNIPLDEYLKKSKEWKKRMKLWRTSLEFKEQDLPIDPYVLGMWLGDGHSHTATLTTMDDELKGEWYSWVMANGDGVSVYSKVNNKANVYAAVSRTSSNDKRYSIKFNNKLRSLDLLNNKHIPYSYLVSSRIQRLKLLAGLIDTDGNLSYTGKDKKSAPVFEITQKNEKLANDIAYLARSLGFKVKVEKCKKSCQTGAIGIYNRLIIFGKLSEIPTKLARKQSKDCTKSPLTSGFVVKPIGKGDYYGFTLDGDHLYLLGDFTVTHNTSVCITIAAQNVLRGKKVLFLTHEGNPADIKEKLWSSLLGLTKKQLFDGYRTPQLMGIMRAYLKYIEENLTYIALNDTNNTVEKVGAVIEKHQERALNKDGRGYDLLIDDYPAKLSTDMAKGGQFSRRNIDEIVYNEFVQLGLKYKFHNILPIQTNREGSRVNAGQREKRLLTMEDVMESWGPMTAADTVISLNRSPKDIKDNKLTFYICKSRSGDVGWAVTCKSDYSICRTHSNELGAVAYRGNSNPADLIDQIIQSKESKIIE